MQGGHEPHAVLFLEQAVLLGHRDVRPDEPLGGDAPQAHHDLRPDDAELLPQPGQAGVPLFGQRVAVLRRAALDDVGDENVLVPRQVHRGEILVQQLAAAAHKGQALLVLVFAGAFADEHHFRRFGAGAEHHVGAGLTQAALAAGQTLLFELFKFHRWRFLSGRVQKNAPALHICVYYIIKSRVLS